VQAIWKPFGTPLQQFFSPAEIAVEEIAVEEIAVEEIVVEEIVVEEIVAEEIVAEEIVAEEIAAEEIAAEDSLEGRSPLKERDRLVFPVPSSDFRNADNLLLASTPVHSNQDRE